MKMKKKLVYLDEDSWLAFKIKAKELGVDFKILLSCLIKVFVNSPADNSLEDSIMRQIISQIKDGVLTSAESI